MSSSSSDDGFLEIVERKADYDLKEEIGSGAYSKVRKAISKSTGQTVAVKIVFVPTDDTFSDDDDDDNDEKLEGAEKKNVVDLTGVISGDHNEGNSSIAQKVTTFTTTTTSTTTTTNSTTMITTDNVTLDDNGKSTLEEYNDMNESSLPSSSIEIKIKEYKPDKDVEFYQKQLSREIEALKVLNGNLHIISLLDVIEDDEGGRIWIVTEYVDGGDLYTLMDLTDASSRLSEKEARFHFSQLLNAVDTVHSHGIAHRDIKPENILFTKNDRILKLCDFGLCKFKDEYNKSKLFKTYCGTENFIAPEILMGQKYDGFKADIWSCGCVLYTMLCGIFPFDKADMCDIIQAVINVKYDIPDHLSVEAVQFLKFILVKDPRERPTLLEVMSHPWMKKLSE